MLTVVVIMSDDVVSVSVVKGLFVEMHDELNTRDKHFDSRFNELNRAIDSNQLLMLEKLNSIATTQMAQSNATADKFNDHETRLRTLEAFNSQNYGARRATDKNISLFSNNWFKVVMVFVMIIPLVDFLYEQVTGKYNEYQINVDRNKGKHSDDTNG
ncbi:TMhelix containing protein [Vibrio phage 2.096.O._10N.286.48.B5]|nr:TMhelix containing protein [Vibrio phage 2.096.O._10N.286.48.B5]